MRRISANTGRGNQVSRSAPRSREAPNLGSMERVDLRMASHAATPHTGTDRAVPACGVWEHAYYVDYRNARAKYVESFWNLVNWDFVSAQMA